MYVWSKTNQCLSTDKCVLDCVVQNAIAALRSGFFYELIYRLYAMVTSFYSERTSVYTLLTSLPVYILITSLYSGLG